MLLRLPPPPRRLPAPSHQLSPSPSAAAPTVLFPARILRSRFSFSGHLTSPSPFTPFASFSPFTSQKDNWAADGVRDTQEEKDEESIIGDCLVFEEGAFEGGDPFLPPDTDSIADGYKSKKPRRKKPEAAVSAEDLVPEKWKEMLAEINLTKKEKRRISQELKFGSRLERRKKLPVPDLVEYKSYRDTKLSQLKPVVLDNPRELPPPPPPADVDTYVSERVLPRNPRLTIKDQRLGVITDFFNSGEYVPVEGDDDKKPGRDRVMEASLQHTMQVRSLYTLPGEKESYPCSAAFLLHPATIPHTFFLVDAAAAAHEATAHDEGQISPYLNPGGAASCGVFVSTPPDRQGQLYLTPKRGLW